MKISNSVFVSSHCFLLKSLSNTNIFSTLGTFYLSLLAFGSYQFQSTVVQKILSGKKSKSRHRGFELLGDVLGDFESKFDWEVRYGIWITYLRVDGAYGICVRKANIQTTFWNYFMSWICCRRDIMNLVISKIKFFTIF